MIIAFTYINEDAINIENNHILNDYFYRIGIYLAISE
jgi:hypothetical protein